MQRERTCGCRVRKIFWLDAATLRDQNAPTMKSAHVLLIALFVSLTVLADVLIFRALPEHSMATNILVAGLSFGQVGLVTAWFVFGRAPIWVRLTALAMTVVFLGWFFSKGSATTNSLVEWQGFLALFVSGEAAVLLWLRLRGLRVIGNVEFDQTKSPTSEHRTWQFSLNGMLITMTLACLAAAVVRWIKPDDWIVLLLYCSALIPITCLALWIVWGGRSPILRIVVAVPAIMVLSLAVGLVEGDREIDWNLLLLSLVQSSYVVVGSLIARIGGLKLKWLSKP